MRVKALIKRYHPQQEQILKVGKIRLDPIKHEVKLNERVVQLNRKEFSILELSILELSIIAFFHGIKEICCGV